MNKTQQRIQYRSHYEVGTGTQVPSGTRVPLVVTIEYGRHDPTTLAIDLIPLGNEDERNAVLVFLRYFHDEISLPSDEAGSPSVEVLGTFSMSGDGSRISLDASEVRIGITAEPQEQETIWVVVIELTPSGILISPGIRNFSYTGDVNFEPITPGEIIVSSTFGQWQVGTRYDHYESEEFGNKVTHSVQRASVTGSLTIPKGQSLASVNKLVVEEVEHICTMLSFCYRQPVDFYEIRYVTDPNTTPRDEMRRATIRRHRHSHEKRIDHEELIHYNNLIDGGLDQLLQNYKESKHRGKITRAISFLAASYKMDILEASYFLAYSALDLIASTNKVKDVALIDPSKWEKIQGLLSTYLDSIAEVEEITSVVEQLKEKLPALSLHRMSGDKRIIEACQRLGVKTDDLWRKDGFEAGLKSASGIRNRLFHAAGGGDMGDQFVNLIRIRALVERLILGTLDWTDERTWVWKNQDLARIRD